MSPDEVSTSLGELERKLKALEQELEGAAPRPAPAPNGAHAVAPASVHAPAPSPPPAPVAPAVVHQAQGRVGDLHGQLDELLRFRGELERTARELLAEYDRVLGSLGAAAPLPLAAPALAPAPTGPPVGALPPPPAAVTAAPPPTGLPPQPWQPAPQAAPAPAAAPQPGGDDAVRLEGTVVLDAGPFSDIGVLSGFEQALQSVPGVQDVYVRGFEGDRVVVDVTLDRAVALGSELRRTSTVPFTFTVHGPGTATVTLGAGA